MTEPTEIVDDRAARLARLQARRGTGPSVTSTASSFAGQPTTATPESVSLPAPTTASVERTAPIDPSPKQTRRRSPATNAKIITIGASTTALLGMMAGYGISDGLTSEATETAASTAAPITPTAPAAPIAPASPTTTPPVSVTTAPPQVIVVMVDAGTGRPISTTTGNGEGVLESALGSIIGAQPAQPAAPAPVAAPAAVDLAVPAAPQPAPAAASQPAAQASSGGS